VALQRLLHMVFAATSSARYRSPSTNDALAFLSAPKLPSELPRDFQMCKFIVNAFTHFNTFSFYPEGGKILFSA
jgi:hypothetical protein